MSNTLTIFLIDLQTWMNLGHYMDMK